RKAVIVVAAGGKADVDQRRSAAANRQFANPPSAVEQETFPIARPVWGLDMIAGVVDHTPVFRGNRDGFQSALQDRFARWIRPAGNQFHVGKDGLFQRVVVMGANGQADEEWLVKFDFERTAGRAE